MVLALAGCDGPVHGLGPGSSQIARSGGGNGAAGTYALQSANGLALPVLLTGTLATDRTELTAGTFVLGADSSYAFSLTTRTTTGTQQASTSSSETGRYSIDGSVINLLASDGLSWVATINDRTIQTNIRYTPTGVSYNLSFTR
jgi:hypothetical protein